MNNVPRILVLEDDEDISFMIKLMLERKGFSVMVAAKTDEAMEIVRNNSTDLIIMDMFLSGVNSLETCTALKKNHETAHIPVVMISGHPNAREVCKAAGADDFISKPFDMEDLLSSVNHSLQSHIV